MNDDRFEDFLREAAREYNPPPETPRDLMWARIQAIRTAGKRPDAGGGPGGEPNRGTVPPAYRRFLWPMGIAALLALAFGVGRMSTRQGSNTFASQPAAVAAPGNRAVTFATLQHLSRAETFLTGFRADARTGQEPASFAGSARDLLSTTRLLLDSPSLSDQRLRGLLEDLEFTLAQIAQIQAEQRTNQLDLITKGLEQRHVLPRLRSAIPSGPVTRAVTQGEI